MLRLFKWLAGLALSIVLLIAIAAVILPRVIDPNDFRAEIAQLVAEKTGRTLGLDGDLRLSVFPWLGIHVEGLSLSQPDIIGGDMLRVDSAQLRVKLLPLFSSRVEVDTVVLESPAIRLVTLKDGTDSFAGLADQASQQEPNQASDGASMAVALVIQGLRISDGKIVIDDRQAATVTDIEGLNLTTGNLLGNDLADVKMDGVLKGTAGSADTQFELTALANINVETAALNIENLQADVTMGTQAMLFGIDSLKFTQPQEIKIVGLSSQVLGVLDANQPLTLTVQNISANLDQQKAQFSPLMLNFGSLNAQIDNLQISDIANRVDTSARVKINEFDAIDLLKLLAIDYQPAGSQALRKVAAQFDLKANINSASVQNLLLKVDSTSVRGSASVNDYTVPKIAFDLQLDRIDLDQYLPVDAGGDSANDTSGSAMLAVPMAAFKGVNANGRLQAQQMISSGLQLNNIDVQVASTPGQVTITPRADLYQGKLGGAIKFTEGSSRSELKIQNEVDLVALGELLNAADISDQLSGIGSLVLDLVVAEENGQQTNQGTIKLFAKDGAIQGVDIKGIVDNAYGKYQQFKGRESTPEQGKSMPSDETKFAELLGTFYLKNSVLKNDDFELKAPLFRIGGAGTIDLENQTLDYLVQFSVVNSSSGQGGEAFEKLKGITLPIRLRGDLTAPSYSLDMQALYKGLLKSKKSAFLQEKLGIEGGDKLSNRDVLQQLLINKAQNKNSQQSGQERPISDVGTGAIEKNSGPAAAEDQESKDNPADSAPQKSSKEQLKDDLKKKLLDGLFN